MAGGITKRGGIAGANTLRLILGLIGMNNTFIIHLIPIIIIIPYSGIHISVAVCFT